MEYVAMIDLLTDFELMLLFLGHVLFDVSVSWDVPWGNGMVDCNNKKTRLNWNTEKGNLAFIHPTLVPHFPGDATAGIPACCRRCFQLGGPSSDLRLLYLQFAQQLFSRFLIYLFSFPAHVVSRI